MGQLPHASVPLQPSGTSPHCADSDAQVSGAHSGAGAGGSPGPHATPAASAAKAINLPRAPMLMTCARPAPLPPPTYVASSGSALAGGPSARGTHASPTTRRAEDGLRAAAASGPPENDQSSSSHARA